MRKAVGACVAACAVLAAPATAGAATKTVYAGGPVGFQNQLEKKFGGGVDNFLLNRVTINAGDTVVWNGKSLANGFHTVDFPAKGGSAVPLIVPGPTVSGANDAAGNPFWFNGKVPSLGFNLTLLTASKSGTYSASKRFDTGLPVGKPKDFKLKFTKPGVYKYFCDVHPGMIGYVVVKAKGQKIPSKIEDGMALVAAEAAYVNGAKQLDKTKPAAGTVSVGASGANGLEVFAMFPSSLSVKAGTTVTFSMPSTTREVHTASFGPQAYLGGLAQSILGPSPRQEVFYPSDPPGTTTETPTSHGNGFANTGAMDRDKTTPLPSSGTIKFTAPGTYQFICLIHPFMHGTVVVTP